MFGELENWCGKTNTFGVKALMVNTVQRQMAPLLCNCSSTHSIAVEMRTRKDSWLSLRLEIWEYVRWSNEF